VEITEMTTKKERSKEEMKAVIDEILHCSDVLKKQLGEYPTNAINRLIEARIKLNVSTIKKGES
jgi:hypothetical protein